MSENPPPPPAASPRPPEPEPTDTQEIPVTMGTMRRAFRLNEIWTFLVAVATAGAALLGGYALFIEKAEAAGKKAAAEVAEDVKKLKEDQGETRQDVRALYRAVMTGRPQERLEAPLVVQRDGGQ